MTNQTQISNYKRYIRNVLSKINEDVSNIDVLIFKERYLQELYSHSIYLTHCIERLIEISDPMKQ